MPQDKFTRREVERSFRKFNDIVTDMMRADFRTWDDCFTHLITHCEQDPAMHLVTAPLRANRNVDPDKWYTDCMESLAGMVGTARYKLPTDDDDRTALLYQFFLKIEKERLDITDFCLAAYGRSDYQEMVDLFNQELVEKFTREVSYRLDEIMEDIGNDREVSANAMMVFHYHDHSQHDHSTQFHGSIKGSNVATGGSSISESSATYNNGTELASALKALKPLVQEVGVNQKEAVEAALALLVEATHKEKQVAEVATALSKVAEASPTLKARLKEIGQKIGLQLVDSSLSLAFKSLFGTA
jgi:hypothetical protein